jgi:hypothetical protein
MFFNILYLFPIAIFAYYNNNNILTQLITIDSIFTSINFLVLHMIYNQKIKITQETQKEKIKITQETQAILILKATDKLYTSNLLDRYIYYIIITLFYYTLCNFFWIDYKYNKILLILSTPNLLNYILKLNIFTRIKQKKQYIIKIIITKQVAFLIKTCSRIYLNKIININYLELMDIFINYDKTYENFIKCLKTSIIIFIITHIKLKHNYIYYKLSKYVYNYTTGEYLISYDSKSSRELLLDIIINKKYDMLLKSNTYSAIIFLYYENNIKDNYLELLFNNFKYKITSLIAIWTLSSYFNSLHINININITFIIISNIALLIINKTLNYKNIIILLSYLSTNIFLINFICQFSNILVFNKLTYNVYKFLYQETKNKIITLFNNNKLYNKFILILYFLVIINRELNIFSIILNSIISKDYVKILITNVLLLSCYISDYHLLHVLHNLIILYIICGFNSINIYIENLIEVEEIKVNKTKVNTENIEQSYFMCNKSNSLQDLLEKIKEDAFKEDKEEDKEEIIQEKELQEDMYVDYTEDLDRSTRIITNYYDNKTK